MNIWKRIVKRFRPHDFGHIAYLTIPEELINNGWYKFEMTVDGFNTKHEGRLTMFSGKVRVEMIE
jgi:hypothetical protein